MRLIGLFVVLLFSPLSSGYAIEFEFSHEPTDIIVEYHRYSLKFAKRDPHPRLRIYGSGAIDVYFPNYMQRAGLYRLEQSEAQINDIITSLLTLGTAEIDVASIAQQQEALQIQRESIGKLFYTSDATVTFIQLNLTAYRYSDNNNPQPLAKELVWDNLQSDALRFPSLRQLVNLAQAERLMMALVDHPALVWVELATPLESIQ